jgi:membrane protease subunit HflK
MRTLRWGLLVLLAGYLLTGLVQVRPGELAVVRRFGRVLPEKPEPGLWIGLPWGMDRVDRVAVDRLQSVSVGYQDEEGSAEAMPAGQLLTGDHNLVNVRATLFYKVRAGEVEDYVLQGDRVEGLLARAVEAVLAEWVGSHTVDEVLLNGKNALRPVLSGRTQERIEPYRLGVQVLDSRVALVGPPDDVRAAFDNVALQQTGNEKRRNQAEQEVKRDLRLAEAARYQLEQETAAYVRNTRLLAQRDAERFLERLRQYQVGRQGNPHYLRQIWEEERGKLFEKLKQNRQIDLLDHHLGANGLDLITAPPLPQKP